MDVQHVVKRAVYMAALPLDAKLQFMVMAHAVYPAAAECDCVPCCQALRRACSELWDSLDGPSHCSAGRKRRKRVADSIAGP